MCSALPVHTRVHIWLFLQAQLECYATGSPFPSIIWKTPLSDYISDPYRGEWIDGSIESTSPEKKYLIYATGETIQFSVK